MGCSRSSWRIGRYSGTGRSRRNTYLLDGCQDEEVHGEDEELERHGDLVNTIGPQVHGQSEGRVRGLKQGDGDDGGGVGDGSEASQQLLP